MILFYAAISIVFSFLCSIWEAVLLSVTPSYVSTKMQEGGTTGELLNKFKNDVNAPLTAILSLNTVAHTVGAILVGAETGATFGEGAVAFSLFGYEVGYELIVSVAMTLAVLIISEIVPKNIGATYWKQLATALTRIEFLAIAEAQQEEGQLKAEEGRILKNLFSFESLTVHDVMTPRTVVVGAKDQLTIGEFYTKFDSSPFSRFPVFGETRDQVRGYVLKDMVYKSIIEKREEESIQTLLREMLLVPQTTSLHKLIDMMLERREPIALVVDEFGGMEGIVTMEDAMETLLGLEIMDEMDTSQDMQDLARRRWRKRAESMGINLKDLEEAQEGGTSEETTK